MRNSAIEDRDHSVPLIHASHQINATIIHTLLVVRPAFDKVQRYEYAEIDLGTNINGFPLPLTLPLPHTTVPIPHNIKAWLNARLARILSRPSLA